MKNTWEVTIRITDTPVDNELPIARENLIKILENVDLKMAGLKLEVVSVLEDV